MRAERLYRLLLRLYPRPFRSEFEESMLELFRHRRERTSGFALWSHLALDLLVSVPREWLFPSKKSRRTRRRAPTSAVGQDCILALRSARRSFGTIVLAVAILGVGFGTSVAVFATVNGVLLRPLPYPDADRIVRLWANDPEVERFSFTKIEFRAYAERNEVFEAVGGDFPIELTLTATEGEPERLVGALTTPGYFEVFGASPVLGRTFTFDDIDSGDPRIAVISHGLWTRRYGSDPEVVGRVIQLDGESFTVLGILPQSYRHITAETDVFIPYTVGTSRWTARWLELSAKLKRGISLQRAQADIDAMTAVLAEAQERTRGWSMTVEPLSESTVGSTRPAMWAAFGAVLLLFALAAVNVTSLVLARAATRQHDYDLRAALGAGPFERVRQSVFENLLVGFLGVGAGAGLAWEMTPRLVALGVYTLPRLSSFELDGRVLSFACVLGLSTILLLGAAPVVFSAARRGRSSVLTGRAATSISYSTAKLLGALVVLETALAVAILTGAGLLMRSYLELLDVDPGYDATEAVAMTVSIPSARYASRESRVQFFDQLLERMNALPETVSSALTAYRPLGGRGALSFLNSESRVARDEPRVSSLQRVVSPDFFRTLRVPLVRGSSFDRHRPEGSPRQVVVGAALARQIFGDEDPIGKRVTSSESPGPEDWRVVVGVAGDVRYIDLAQAPETQFYEPFDEQAWRTVSVVVRTRSRVELASLVDSVRQVLGTIDPEVPVFDVERLDTMTRRSAARPRFNAAVFGVFASVALALAIAGIYGILSFVTARRTQEIGIRMAFGASREQVIRAFVRRAMSLTASGTVLGLSLAAFSFYGLRSLLFGVSPFDPFTAVTAAVTLLASAVTASFLPARRASRVDPMQALRQE